MADSRRTYVKKQLDFSVGNLSWASKHLTEVLTKFYEAVTEHNAQGLNPPDEYIAIGDEIGTLIEGIELIQKAIEAINNKV